MNMNLSDSDRWLTWTELRSKYIRRQKRREAIATVLLVLGLVLAGVFWWMAWEMR